MARAGYLGTHWRHMTVRPIRKGKHRHRLSGQLITFTRDQSALGGLANSAASRLHCSARPIGHDSSPSRTSLENCHFKLEPTSAVPNINPWLVSAADSVLSATARSRQRQKKRLFSTEQLLMSSELSSSPNLCEQVAFVYSSGLACGNSVDF